MAHTKRLSKGLSKVNRKMKRNTKKYPDDPVFVATAAVSDVNFLLLDVVTDLSRDVDRLKRKIKKGKK